MVRKDKVSHKGFDRLVERALVTLPDEFQSYLENVVVVIEEEPPADMPDVMGLYEGIPLVERSLDDTSLPDHITLFKGPIVRACNTYDEIEGEVRITVLHEIGHFFGLEEVQLQKLEVQKNPGILGKKNR